MQVTIDPVCFDDPVHLRWWYELRNAESTRRGCRSMKKITVDEHFVWWHESKLSKTRKMFFVRCRKVMGVQPEVVGFLRLDKRSDTTEWTEISIAISPEWRGNGVGATVVRHAVHMIGAIKWPTPGAVINGRNAASLSLFLRAGFLLKRKGFIQVTKLNTGGRR